MIDAENDAHDNEHENSCTEDECFVVIPKIIAHEAPLVGVSESPYFFGDFANIGHESPPGGSESERIFADYSKKF